MRGTLLAFLLLTAGVMTGDAQDLGSLRAKLPGSTGAILVMKTDPASRTRLAEMSPVPIESVGEVLKQQCAEFEKATGLNPYDAEYLVLAAGEPTREAGPVLILKVSFDPAKVKAALEKTPQLSGKLRSTETALGTAFAIDETYVLFTRDQYILVGRRAVLKEILDRKGQAAELQPALARNLEKDLTRGPLFFRVALSDDARRKFAGGPAQGPFNPQILSHMIVVHGSVTETGLTMKLEFDEAGAAEAAESVFNGMVDTALSQSENHVTQAREAARSSGPLAPLDPQLVGALIGYRSSKHLVETLRPKLDGTHLVFDLNLKGSGLSTSVLLAAAGVAAAVAIPNFTRARGDALAASCRANQKVLAGATEMYALDKGVSTSSLTERIGTPEFLETLVQEGYLQEIPEDPGQGEGSFTNYYGTGESALVGCRVHGAAEE